METTQNTMGAVLAAFRYWGTVPALVTTTSVDQLRRDYQGQSGPVHWFDADTLRFFGSRGRALVAPGLLVECQTNAPEGAGRYVVTAWVVDADQPRDHRTMGRITPQRLGDFPTRAAAVRFALAAGAAWPVGADTSEAVAR